MNNVSRGSAKIATLGLIAAVVGLWPLYFFIIVWAWGQWGGEGEFSLETYDPTRNVVLLAVSFIIAFAAAAAGVVLGIVNLAQRKPGRKRALAGLILGGVGVLITVTVLVLFLILRGSLTRSEKRMTLAQEISKCRSNQRTIEMALGPEMWGYDHPGFKPEDLRKLDLSPKGDLTSGEVAYINDQAVLDCPADEDPNDVDYAVDVTPEGVIKVHCIDADGIKRGHNE